MSTQSDLYEAKADFSSIYNRTDPRTYFGTLGDFGYEIPTHGVPVFERLLDQMGGRDHKAVLDVCCSYGVNAALLNHNLDLDDLYGHYADYDTAVDSSALEKIDRRWFSAHRREDAVHTIGLDVAENAVHYASSVGLLDGAVVADLESAPPDDDDAKVLGSADLVTVTGGIGYIGEKTLRTVVEAAGDAPPWIAVLSLRWIDFEPIAESLDRVGLVTERFPAYRVMQRRFADTHEREAALSGLRDLGVDCSAEVEADAHFAELLVARPPEAVRDSPIDEMLQSLPPGFGQGSSELGPTAPTIDDQS